jgi:hypothetical protein
MWKLTVTLSILTCSSLYNFQYFPLLFVIIFLKILQRQSMAPEKYPAGAIGAGSSRTTGASPNAPLGATQQQCKHQLVRPDAAIVAAENQTQDEYFKKVRKTGSSKNQQQHAIGCKSIHICVNDGQLEI